MTQREKLTRCLVLIIIFFLLYVIGLFHFSVKFSSNILQKEIHRHVWQPKSKNTNILTNITNNQSGNVITNPWKEQSWDSTKHTDVPSTVESLEQLFQIQKKQKLLIYNRVPKCGSKAIRLTINKMQTSQNFKVILQDYGSGFRQSNPKTQKQITSRIHNQTGKQIFIRHIHFVDFSHFGMDTPYYLNVIRDPFRRILSWYYFKIFYKEKLSKLQQQQRSVFPFTNLTLDQCVETKHGLCTSPHLYFTLVPWFCGNIDLCMKPSINVLNIAKQNVVKHYPLVGYVENIQQFFQAAENIWPQFFHGMARVGEKMMVTHEHKTKTYREEPSNKTVEYFMSKMGLDYDFYHFIKQRFQFIYSNLFKENSV